MRLRANFEVGTITNNPLASGATTINSTSFSTLPVVSSPDLMAITLDPEGVNGIPEIVHIIDHASAATSVTVVRGQEATVAREHPADTEWVNALTAEDIDDLYDTVDSAVARSGDTMTGFLTLSGDPTDLLHAATKQYIDDAVADVEVDWATLSGKPATFPPDTHNHDGGDIASGTVAFARLPTGNGATQVAVGNHPHTYISSTTPINVADNSYAAYRVRNIWIGSSTPSATGRQTGDVWFDTSA